MKKVTVLIPTLNSIAYMKECLESVINQTLCEMEILVIDAGSTDGTLELVEDYCKKDDRIGIVHSEKKSYGYQLNKGITIAEGNYVGVVESDDVIEPDMYKTLFEEAEKTDADFVKGNFTNFAVTNDNQKMVITDATVSKNIMGKLMNPSENKDIYIQDFYLWRGIYKKKFLEQNHITFNETRGAAYQDIGFLYQTFTQAQKAVYLDKCFYNYRRNNSNSSTYSPKAFSYLAKEYDYIIERFGQNNELFEQWATYFYRKMFIQCRARVRLLAFDESDIESVMEDVMYLQKVLREACIKNKINLSIWDMNSQMEFFMFIDDIKSYIEYYRIQMGAKKQCLSSMMERLKKFTEIILVSDSKLLQFVYALLDKNGVNSVVGICDNNELKWGNIRMGVPIISVEQACINSNNKAYVITNLRAKNELKQQLNSLGVKDEQIFLYDLGYEWLFIS